MRNLTFRVDRSARPDPLIRQNAISKTRQNNSIESSGYGRSRRMVHHARSPTSLMEDFSSSVLFPLTQTTFNRPLSMQAVILMSNSNSKRQHSAFEQRGSFMRASKKDHSPAAGKQRKANKSLDFREPSSFLTEFLNREKPTGEHRNFNEHSVNVTRSTMQGSIVEPGITRLN